MLKPAHILVGTGAASFIVNDPLMLSIAAFFSAMPDLDRHIKHRAWFSHSLFAAAILSIAGFVASGFQSLYAVVILITLSSHILLDFFTHSGVPVLFPISSANYGLRLVSSDNRPANRIFGLFGAVMLYFNLSPHYAISTVLWPLCHNFIA